MKKIMIFIAGLVFGLLTIPVASAINEYVCSRVDYPVYINNVEYKGDLPLLNYNSNTYVPLRAFLEAAGLSVVWDGNTKQVLIASAANPSDSATKTMAQRAKDGEIPMTITTPDGVTAYCLTDGYYINKGNFYTVYKDKDFALQNQMDSKGWYISRKSTGETIKTNIDITDNQWIAYDYYCIAIMPLLIQSK